MQAKDLKLLDHHPDIDWPLWCGQVPNLFPLHLDSFPFMGTSFIRGLLHSNLCG